MVTDELSMLYTHISSSIDFTIPTIAILDLAKIVDTWITDGDCGAIIAHKGTASMMKERLTNALISDSRETQYRRVVLFIDEAFLLTEKDFIWLMDIHNNLDMCNVHLTVLMFGTNELKGIKNAYCRARRFQIVDRFIPFLIYGRLFVNLYEHIIKKLRVNLELSLNYFS